MVFLDPLARAYAVQCSLRTVFPGRYRTGRLQRGNGRGRPRERRQGNLHPSLYGVAVVARHRETIRAAASGLPSNPRGGSHFRGAAIAVAIVLESLR